MAIPPSAAPANSEKPYFLLRCLYQPGFCFGKPVRGAVSTPEWLSYMDYFIRKEYGNNYYLHVDDLADLSSRQRTIDKVITDAFEQVVYSLNQPAAARGNQSVFWNIAYFDHPYFEGMFETFVFPDGTPMCWASVNWLQKRFMRWFNQERTRKLLTISCGNAQSAGQWS